MDKLGTQSQKASIQVKSIFIFVVLLFFLNQIIINKFDSKFPFRISKLKFVKSETFLLTNLFIKDTLPFSWNRCEVCLIVCGITRLWTAKTISHKLSQFSLCHVRPVPEPFVPTLRRWTRVIRSQYIGHIGACVQ